MAAVDTHMPLGEPSAARSAARYGAALRHSACVQRLKLLVPLLAIAAASVFVLLSVLSRTLPADVSVERATFANGLIVMENPVLTAQTGSAQTFTVDAARAVQRIDLPNVITLSQITARLPVNETDTAYVEAAGGVFDRASETLTLDQPFRVVGSTGIEIDLESAAFDIGEGTMVSDGPVSVRIGETSLVAQTVRMLDNGQRIVFERDVRMTIAPSTLRDTETQ